MSNFLKCTSWESFIVIIKFPDRKIVHARQSLAFMTSVMVHFIHIKWPIRSKREEGSLLHFLKLFVSNILKWKRSSIIEFTKHQQERTQNFFPVVKEQNKKKRKTTQLMLRLQKGYSLQTSYKKTSGGETMWTDRIEATFALGKTGSIRSCADRSISV